MPTHLTPGKFPAQYATRLVNTFMLIDDLLIRATHCLDPVSLASPLSMHMADVTSARQQVVADHAAHVRKAMRDILQHHGISIPRPATSAARSSRVLIDEALIAAAGLDPRRGSDGAGLSPETTEDVYRIVNEVMDLLAVLTEDLSDPDWLKTGDPGSQQGLDEDLAVLLQEMKRITKVHGFAHLDLSIDALIERLQSRDITVGVFGAVNSGKSSLLNCLLGSTLLPVSAMPATVLPIHVSYGLQEHGQVEFADAKPEAFDRARLAEFTDAHFNPNNLRHVARIRFKTPAPALACGVALIDMPGMAQLADTAAFMARAQMLRCDLAVVLVSAVASLTLDEAKLIDALHHAGTDAMVLVTKADLLAPEERWRIYGHVVRELWQKAHFEVPVYVVSTRDTNTALCRAWIDGPLAEYIALYRGRQQGCLQRKINMVRNDMLDTLEQQLLRSARTAPCAAERFQLLAALSNTRTELEQALATPPGQDASPRRDKDTFISELAHNAAVLWMEDRDLSFDITRLLELAAVANARGTATMTVHQIEKLRAQATVTLIKAADSLELPRNEYGYFPVLSSLPVFDLAGKLPDTVIPRTWDARLLGRWGFYLAARRKLRRSTAIAVFERVWNDYLATLHAWKQSNLEALIKTYAEQQHKLREYLSRRDETQTPGPASHWTNELRAEIAMLREHAAQWGR